MDFHTAFAAYHGLTHVAVIRLRRSFDSLSVRSRQLWADVQTRLDGRADDFAWYRRTLESEQDCVPYIGTPTHVVIVHTSDNAQVRQVS